MKAWMMALIAGAARILKTAGPFTVNTVFNVPANVNRLESVTGRGGSGSPGLIYYDVTQIVSVVYDSPAYGQNNTTETTTRIYEPSNPTSGCLAPVYYPADHATVQYCYTFTTGRETGTIGANTTAFGKVFPGGVDGPATAVTYTNVPTTGGSAQPLIIPLGGAISSIKFYE